MTEPSVRLRAAIAKVPAYVAGKPAAAREDLTVFKVSSNENPYPPLPSVLETVREHAGEINRYPDMGVGRLTEALADHVGVSADMIATGTGSVGVLAQIVGALCEPGDEVVFAWRSFEAYPIIVTLAGAEPVAVPLTADAAHDLPAMAAAITERTSVVLVCTPNNPTGPAVTQRALREFLQQVPDQVVVVIDEAYLEFVRGEDPVDSLALLSEHPNAIVLRTFSKAYGLAGLRIGYAIAHPLIASALRKTATPFGVNTLAQVAGVASLQAQDELDQRVAALVAERDRVQQALREQGWETPDSQANFVWFPVGTRSPDLVAACDAAGLVVRPYGEEGVRVSIGEPEANDRLIEVAGSFLSGEAAALR